MLTFALSCGLFHVFFFFFFCLFRLLKSRGKFKHLNVTVLAEHSEITFATPPEVRTTCSAMNPAFRFNTHEDWKSVNVTTIVEASSVSVCI